MTTPDTFAGLALCEPLQRALSEKGYTQPSPIQAAAIPPLLDFKDLLGAAQTGTGKTASFALPILHHLHVAPRPLEPGRFRALVLTPTRELAVQVDESFRSYGRNMRVSTALVYGGVSAGAQIRALRGGVDVLVATPGRLLDLYNQGRFDFGGVEFFVLDEADRMLDMGFINDIRKVVEQLPENRQSLFFSATLSESITKLAGTILTDPVEVRIAPQTKTTESVDHRLCLVDRNNKMSLLELLVKDQHNAQGRNLTLVFSRTKHGADRLARNLKRNGARVEAIHGDKSQRERQRSLERFRDGRAPILVATDVAARGIDVKDITLVVNYDLPNEPEAYIHRIGRTGRGGAEGCALSFCTGEDFEALHAIEKLVQNAIPLLAEHPYHCDGLARKREEYTLRANQPRQGQGRRRRSGGRGGRPGSGKFRSGESNDDRGHGGNNSRYRGNRNRGPKRAKPEAVAA